LRYKEKEPEMTSERVSERGSYLAALGALLVIPALLVCFAGALNLSSSSFLIHPALVMGGLVMAFGLNLMRVLRLELRRQEDGLIGMVGIRCRWPNLAILAFSAVLTGILLAYGFVENFRVVAR
jgi:hypothetical protein